MSDRLHDLFFNSDPSFALSPMTVFFSLFLSFLLGQLMGWVYMWTHSSFSYSKSFVSSLVVLPVIIAVMMMLMSSSLTIAFGLLAVFAVVRFRNVLKDTRDTTFILWSIVEGMAVGTSRYSISVMSGVAVAVVLLYLKWSDFGTRDRYDTILYVEISGNLSEQLAKITQVLQRHVVRYALVNQQHVSDQNYLLNYRVLSRDPERTQELREELAAVGDVREISIRRHIDESEV